MSKAPAAPSPPKPPINGRLQPCPECGSTVYYWWSASGHDPDDIDPRADCDNRTCLWGY